MKKLQREKLLKEVWKKWESKMLNSNKGKSYLDTKGIDYKKIPVAYEANGIQSNLNDEQKELAHQINLLTKYQSKDSSPFKESVIYPLCDYEGVLVNFAAHKVDGSECKFMNNEGFYPGVPKNREVLIMTLGVQEAAYLNQFNTVKEKADILSLSTGELGADHVIDRINELHLTVRFVVIYNKDQSVLFEIIKEQLTTSNDQRVIDGIEIDDLFKLPETQLLSFLDSTPEMKVDNDQQHESTGVYFNSSKSDKLSLITDKVTYSFLGELPLHSSTLKGVVRVQSNEFRKMNYTESIELMLDGDREKEVPKISVKLALTENQVREDLSRFTTYLLEFRERKPIGQQRSQKVLTDERIMEVTSILRNPNFMELLGELIEKTGVIGQGSTPKMLFSIATS